jgi:predicted Zn-dependent peptidase
MSLESTSARCEQLARQLMIFGQPISMQETMAKIAAVDNEAVARVAGRLLASEPTLALLGPVAEAPPYDELVERLRLS